MNPNSADALLARGGWLLQQADRESALADFAAARRLNPTVAINWHSIQLSKYEYGTNRNLDLALLHLGEMIAVEGQTPAVRVSYVQRRIWSYQQANRVAEQIPDYTRLIESQPREVSYYIERTACYAQTGKPEKATEDFVVALKIDRTTAQQHLRTKLQAAEQTRNWSFAATCIDAWLNSKLAPKEEADLLPAPRVPVMSWTNMRLHWPIASVSSQFSPTIRKRSASSPRHNSHSPWNWNFEARRPKLWNTAGSPEPRWSDSIPRNPGTL